MVRMFTILGMLSLAGLFPAGHASAEKISLWYEGAAQVVIRSPAGRYVMIDVALPGELEIAPGPAIALPKVRPTRRFI